jgi:branched-chain amino acid transport system permease protein
MRSFTIRIVTFALIVAAVAALPLLGEPYYVKSATRALIFGMAALALDLVVGYGGLISFGHAAFLGIGAYVTGILAQNGIDNALVAWPIAMMVAAIFAAIVGVLSLRTSGIYFIFATLGFAQMIYYVAKSSRQYGGDDGFALAASSRFPFGLDMGDTNTLFYTVLVLLGIILFIAHRIVSSRFGRVVQGVRDNARRARSIGINVYPYQVVLFSISGALTGLAGALLANVSSYIEPSQMSWIQSGELLMMVILGSAGTLLGPVLGAAIFIFFEQILSALTSHWMLILGPLLVARVLFLHDGFYGLLVGRGASVRTH